MVEARRSETAAALLAVALLVVPSVASSLALPGLPTPAVASPGTLDAVAVLETILPALTRPYYAQLAGAPLPPWAPAYAWQLTALQNPVIDPGFEAGAPAWTYTAGSALDGAARLSAGGRASQRFLPIEAGPDALACTDGCIGASAVQAVRAISFVAEGKGTVELRLVDVSGRAFSTDPVAFESATRRAYHVPLAAFAPRLDGFPEADAGEASLAEIAFAADAAVVIDDVFVERRNVLDDGPHPRATAAWRANVAAALPAHDGHVVLAFPLAGATPSFLATLVELAPSGARVLPFAGARLESVTAGASVVVDDSPAPLGLDESPYARLLAEAGLEGDGVVLEAPAAAPAALWRFTLVPAAGLYGTEAAIGYFHMAKLADPGSPANDALDIVPDLVGAAAPGLYADFDGDGYTDGVEDALGADAGDAESIPARALPAGREIALELAPPRINVIRFPLATRTGWLSPGEPLVIELGTEEKPEAVHAWLNASHSAIAVTLEPVVGQPVRVGDVWHVPLTLSEVPAPAAGLLFDLDLRWDADSDRQARAVMVVQQVPAEPRIATIANARGPTALAEAVRELNLLRPDAVLVAGDITANITDYGPVYEALMALRAPLLMAPGDADTATLMGDGRAAWEAVFGPRYHATRMGDITFVALDTSDWPNADRALGQGGQVGDAQLAWLRATVPERSRVVAFAHHSPAVPQDSWQRATLQDAIASPDALAFLGAIAPYLPHPLDLPTGPLAATLDGATPQWTGKNRLAVRAALADAELVLNGHALADRAARILPDGAVVEAGPSGLRVLTERGEPTSAAGFPDAGALYLDVAPLGLDGAPWRGYKIVRLANGGIEGYDAPAPAGYPAIAPAGTFSHPLGALNASAAASGRAATLQAENAFAQAENVTLTIVLEATTGRLGPEGLAIARRGNVTHTEVDVRLHVPVGSTATRAIYLDAIAPDARLEPLSAAWTNATEVQVRVDEDVAEDLALDRVEVLRGDDVVGEAAPGTTLDVLLPHDGEHVLRARARDAAGNVETPGDDVRIGRDTLAPAVGIANATGEWVRAAAPQVVCLDERSGCAPDSLTIEPAGPYSDGVHVLRAVARDAAGNMNATNATLRLDSQPPRIVASHDDAWRRLPFTLTLACEDQPGLSGCETAPASHDIAADGTHTFTQTMLDRAGNQNATTFIARLDATAPELRFRVLGVENAPRWFAENVTVMLDASDATSGNLTPEWSSDGENWTRYEAPMVFALDGDVHLRARVHDVAGNMNATDLQFGRDTLPPLTVAPNISTWETQPVTLRFSCIQSLSPCVRTETRVDDGAWTPGNELFRNTTGAANVWYRSIDAAGNVEAARNLTVRLDLVEPSLTFDAALTSLAQRGPITGGSVTHGPSGATVEVSVVDARGLGWNGSTFIEGGLVMRPVVAGRWTLDLSGAALPDGAYILSARALDGAGRASPPVGATFRLDATAPELAVTPPPAVVGARTVGLSLRAADASAFEAFLEARFAAPGAAPGTWMRVREVTMGDITFDASRGDGFYELRVVARDAAGNEATAPAGAFVADTVAPSLSVTSPLRVAATASPYRLVVATADQTNVTLQVNLTRDDGESFTEDVPLLASTRSLAYRITATDAAGHVANANGTVVVVDPTAPVVSFAPGATRGDGGWFVSNVTLRLLADDPGAVLHSRFGGSGAFATGGTLALNGTGRHIVEAYATVERAGETIASAPEQREYLVDLDAPTGELDVATMVREGARLPFSARAADVGSGVLGVSVIVEHGATTRAYPLAPNATGAWTGEIGPFRYPSAPVLRLRVVDSAGRTHEGAPVAVTVTDATPPLISLPRPAAPLVGVTGLRADVTDEGEIREVAFALDGAPLASPWDTRLSANGWHELAATAWDASNNSATATTRVLIANSPTLGALVIEPEGTDRPTSADGGLGVRVAAASAGPRDVTVVLYHRASAQASFAAVPMTREGDAFAADLTGPWAPGTTLELYAVAKDGDATARTPVRQVTVKLPPNAPLSTWRASADGATNASLVIEHDWADIADAAVLSTPESSTFAMELAAPFRTDERAWYYVEFARDADAAPTFAYNMSYPVGTDEWRVTTEPSGEAAPHARLVVLERELLLHLDTRDLVADLGVPPSTLTVRFRTNGSEDITLQRIPLDLVAPVITHTPPTGTARGTRLLLNITTDEAADVRVFPRVDGVDLSGVPVVDGLADLGSFDAAVVSYLVVAQDAAGNVASIEGAAALADVTPPTAALAALGGALDVDEDGQLVLTAEGSRDDVALGSVAWDLDADGAFDDGDALRVTASFPTAGRAPVAVRVADAAGNTGYAFANVTVRDVTAPLLSVLSPGAGEVLPLRTATVRVSAEDAASVHVRIDDGAWRVATLNASEWALAWAPTEGAHVVTARATDAEGNVALSPAVPIVVDGTAPRVQLPTANLVVALSFPISLSPLVEDANLADVTWQFGDGITLRCETACAAAHTYASAGRYTLTLEATDRAGNRGNATATVLVVAPPAPSSGVAGAPFVAPLVARIAPLAAKAFVNETLTFEAEPARVTETIARSHRWDFGDGTNASGARVRHAYAAPGEYVVRLTVEDWTGRSATQTHTVRVAPLHKGDEPKRAVVVEGFTLVDTDGDGAADAAQAPAGARVIQLAPGRALGLRADDAIVIDIAHARAEPAAVVLADADGFVRAPADGWLVGVARVPANATAVRVAPEGAQLLDDGDVARLLARASAGTTYRFIFELPLPPPPATQVTAPQGLVASPATLTFETEAGATVYWRVVGRGGWLTTREAQVAGDGAVQVEFYALASDGRREVARTLTLDLDGLAPSFRNVTVSPAAMEPGESVRVRAYVEETHLEAVTVTLRGFETGNTTSVALARAGDAWEARLIPGEGRYAVTVHAVDATGRETRHEAGEVVVSGSHPRLPSESVAASPVPGSSPLALLLAVLAAALLARARGGGSRKE